MPGVLPLPEKLAHDIHPWPSAVERMSGGQTGTPELNQLFRQSRVRCYHLVQSEPGSGPRADKRPQLVQVFLPCCYLKQGFGETSSIAQRTESPFLELRNDLRMTGADIRQDRIQAVHSGF